MGLIPLTESMQNQLLLSKVERVPNALVRLEIDSMEALLVQLHLPSRVVLLPDNITRWGGGIVDNITTCLNADAFVRGDGEGQRADIALRRVLPLRCYTHPATWDQRDVNLMLELENTIK